MEKYLSSGGDKNSKNYLSKIFNNSKEKNRKCKSKPKSENIIGNKIFFNTNNKANIKNIDNNSLYDIQDNLFIPKIVYSNNIIGEKNKYNNIRLNNRGEIMNYNNNNNNKNNQEDESNLLIFKEKINNKDLKILELKEELKQLEKSYNDNNRNLVNRYQNNIKSNNKNMFLFYNNSRNGNNMNINNKNKNNKKENKIMYKNNNKHNINRKSYEKKKAKSTPKIGYISDIKNNYFFMMSNKKIQKSKNYLGLDRGKTLDYKNKLNNNKNSSINNQMLINSINMNNNNNNQNINVKKINVNDNKNNDSKEMGKNVNLGVQKKDIFNNVKKNWKNYPNTEPTDGNKNSKNINKQKDISKSINFNSNIEESENINNNFSSKNIIINNQNMINCYINNNNYNNNNLNIYINKNNDNASSQNSYNNSNRNSNNNSNNMINIFVKSKNCNTPTTPSSNCCHENKKFDFEKEIIYDENNKYETLEKNIQYIFNRYFHYYNCKNNSNKK